MMRMPALLIVAAVLSLQEPATAGLYGQYRLRDLLQQASGVVVAQVVRGTNTTGVSLQLEIGKVLKGDILPGSLTYVQVPSELETLRSTGSSSHGIWFLRRAGDNWQVIPTAAGDIDFEDLFLPVSGVGGGVTAFKQPALTVSDRVVVELGKGLGDDRTAVRVSSALFGTDSLLVRELFTLARESSSFSIRVFGLAGLLRQSDQSALQQVEREIGEGAMRGAPQDILLSIEAYYRNSTPEGVATLGRLASSDIRAFQLSAAQALMAIHSRETLPYLAKLLEADDSELRFRAVFGLAAFANNFPVQTADNVVDMGYLSPQGEGWPYRTDQTMRNVPGWAAFQDDEARYLRFWREWWIDVRGELIG